MATLATARNIFKLTTLIAIKHRPLLSTPAPSPLLFLCELSFYRMHPYLSSSSPLKSPTCFAYLTFHCFALSTHSSSKTSCLLSFGHTGSSASCGQMQPMHKPFTMQCTQMVVPHIQRAERSGSQPYSTLNGILPSSMHVAVLSAMLHALMPCPTVIWAAGLSV